MIIKKGNRSVFEIAVVDVNGNLVSNLASADAIKFQVKETKEGNVDIGKTVGSGITADSPETGYLTIIISPLDTTSLTAGDYYMALQIEYAADDVQEIDLREKEDVIETLTIIDDIIKIA